MLWKPIHRNGGNTFFNDMKNEEYTKFIQEILEWCKNSKKKLLPMKEARYRRRLIWIAGLVIALVLMSSGTLWGVYQRGWDNWWTQIILTLLNPPVAQVGEKKISFRKYSKERAPVEFFMKKESSQITEEDVSRIVQEKIVEREMIRILLEEKGILVSKFEAQEAEEKFFPGISKETLHRVSFENYHLYPEDFQKMVIRPLLEREKLEAELGGSQALASALEQFRKERGVKIYLEEE